MIQIILFGALVISNYAIMLQLVRLGKTYLYAYATFVGAMIVVLLPISVDILGFPFALVEVLFATFFLVTDIITELYDRHQARKTLYHAFLGMAAALLFVGAGTHMQLGTFDLSGGYLDVVADLFTPLALVVVFAAFFIEQWVDIRHFHLLKEMTNGKYLWLRNCLSTMTTQSLDVLLVYPVFFYPVLGSDIWMLMIAAVVFKLIMATIDTPFIYLARHIHTPQ